MGSIGRRVQHFVDHVIARCDEADRNQPNHNARPETVHLACADADRGDDAGQHEDVLEPVVDTRDLDVPAESRPGGRGFGCDHSPFTIRR